MTDQPGTRAKSRHALRTATALAVVLLAQGASAEQVPSFNLYGLPGLVDMPTAQMAPDATVGLTYGRVGGSNRGTFIFQITPRLTGAFRYSGIENYDHPDSVDGVYYDRSFDVRYQIFTETDWRPSVVVGLQDFIGTGLFSAEYVVASKTIWPGLTVTGGLGWGRLGSHNAIATVSTRPVNEIGSGGTATYDSWFRGDVAPFGGISYSPNDRLTLKLEYSSDSYELEQADSDFTHDSAINLGVDYRLKNGTQLSGYYAYGNAIGFQVTYTFNPKTLGTPGGVETAGLPVKVRAPSDVRDLGWTANLEGAQASIEERLATSLGREELEVEGFRLEPHRATLRIRNPRYDAPAQAIGRTARVMTRILPASVEEFVIIPSENGVPMSAVTLRRSDLEAHENDAAVEMLARAGFSDAYRLAPPVSRPVEPRFTWALAPYLNYSAFDPQDPLRMDFGAKLSGKFLITPNIELSGTLKKKVVGNIDQIDREDESRLPRVRTDFYRYAQEGDPTIDNLTLAFYGRPGPDLYSRLTVGYLERMYAGASAELLWKPVGSRLALGAEVNYVRRRDYDQLFGLQENTTTDPVSGIERSFPELNGHLSAYYEFGNGFTGQLDVGRYLAGDKGATLTIEREFANGWRLGAFATLTDVSEEDFGEGSFDKGIMLTIPLSVGIGTPSRTTTSTVIRTVQRDGGARLTVPDRLYEKVRTWHEPDVVKSWGRFWR